MTDRNQYIFGMVLSAISLLILLKCIFGSADSADDAENISATENVPSIAVVYPDYNAPESRGYSAIAEQDLFFKSRGDMSKLTPEEEAAQKKAEEEAQAKKKAEEEAQARKKAEEEALAKKKAEEEANRIKPLSAYPDEWPRLKLTGIYQFDDGTAGAIIEGGNTVEIASGDKFSTHFRVGEVIGGGVVLLEIKENSVVLVKDKQSWPINLGATPPAVKKK